MNISMRSLFCSSRVSYDILFHSEKKLNTQDRRALRRKTAAFCAPAEDHVLHTELRKRCLPRGMDFCTRSKAA